MRQYLLLLLPIFLGFSSVQAQYAPLHFDLRQIDECGSWLLLEDTFGAAIIADIDTNQLQWLLLIETGGAVVNTSNNATYGSLVNRNNAGNFEVNQISSIRGDTVFLRFPLRNNYSEDIAAYADVVIQADLSGQVVDGTVVMATNQFNPVTVYYQPPCFLPAQGKVTISGHIDWSRAGFLGASAATNNDNNCNAFTSASAYVYAAADWRGGVKGRGVSATVPDGAHARGRGPLLNGGGGGNDHNSGGGGAGHIGRGGAGAANLEPGTFNCKGNFPGLGGYELPLYHENGLPLLFHGASGGQGHVNNTLSSTGGNGGGIILVYADSLAFMNDAQLSVNGGAGSHTIGDGGGGGGAAGSIFLLTNSMEGSARLFAEGGGGGHVNNSNLNRCFGPGGGGSGGRILSRIPLGPDILTSFSGGLGGESQNSQACAPGQNRGQNGAAGLVEVGDFQLQSLQTLLQIPSSITYPDTVCAGQALQLSVMGSRDCYRSVWWRQSDGLRIPLAENSRYDGANTPLLNILSLPDDLEQTYVLEQLDASNTRVIEQTIRLLVAPRPVAAFDYTLNGNNLVILNNSSSYATSYNWDFGDGNQSSLATPSHTYTQNGLYELRLIANNACGSDTTFALVETLAPAPAAQFNIPPTDFCVGDTLFLTDASLNASQIRWQLNPALPVLPNPNSPNAFVLLTSPSSLEVQLTAFNETGDSSQLTGSINVFETANYNISSSTNGLTINLIANGSGGENPYFISPNGDTIQGTNLVFTAPAPGLYRFEFVAPNVRCGDYQDLLFIELNAPLTAAITTTFNVGCTPFFTSLTNVSEGEINSVNWRIVPENAAGVNILNSSEEVLNLRIDSAGNYLVLLEISGPGGSAVAEQNLQVERSPTAAFAVSENEGLIQLTNLSQNATNYLWDFGDGNSSTLFEPSHQYNSTGLFEISLNAQNMSCSRAVSQSIFVDVLNSLHDPNQSSIRLFPNPAAESITLESPALHFQWVDASGRTMQPLQYKAAGSQWLRLPAQPKGVYWLKLVTTTGVYWRKVIKQ